MPLLLYTYYYCKSFVISKLIIIFAPASREGNAPPTENSSTVVKMMRICLTIKIRVPMKKEQEQYGMHPMTDAEIEAFMSAPSKYCVPPIATPQQEPRYTIPQFIQILAKAGGYKVILEKM